MSEIVMILGMSGSGKSTAIGKTEQLGIKGLNPKTSVLINVDGKRLPCQNGKEWSRENKNLLVTKNIDAIKEGLNTVKEKSHIKNVIIDDPQYAISDKFIHGIKNRVGLGLYTDILYDHTSLLDSCKSLRDDQIVFFLAHLEEYNEDMDIRRRMKVIGKASHKHVTPEGKASVVLYAEGKVENDQIKKFFRTQGDGVHDSVKSPYGMFDQLEIPNDLKYVEDKVRLFWGI